MNKRQTISTLLGVAAGLVAVPPVAAEEYLPNSGWQAFSWSAAPCGQFVNEGPFTFFVEAGCSAVLHVTDAARTAERLEVFDNGQYMGLTTSIPGGICGCAVDCPYTEDFDQAFTTSSWSSGAMELAPGLHSLEFRVVWCCADSIGAFRVVYQDCNCNGTDDLQDLAKGTSLDCNGNGLPDECDLSFLASQDCNGNLVPDECDITSGASADVNANGIPDDCDCLADINGSGEVNVIDLIRVLVCFGLPASPDCVAEDVNFDGTVNVLDLIELLLVFGTSCP